MEKQSEQQRNVGSQYERNWERKQFFFVFPTCWTSFNYNIQTQVTGIIQNPECILNKWHQERVRKTFLVYYLSAEFGLVAQPVRGELWLLHKLQKKQPQDLSPSNEEGTKVRPVIFCCSSTGTLSSIRWFTFFFPLFSRVDHSEKPIIKPSRHAPDCQIGTHQHHQPICLLFSAH